MYSTSLRGSLTNDKLFSYEITIITSSRIHIGLYILIGILDEKFKIFNMFFLRTMCCFVFDYFYCSREQRSIFYGWRETHQITQMFGGWEWVCSGWMGDTYSKSPILLQEKKMQLRTRMLLKKH